NPFIVQSDRSILVEVDNPKYAAARDALAPFAELEKSPEHMHTYRVTPLSLWNAAAAGMTADHMIDVLARYSKFPLPGNLALEFDREVRPAVYSRRVPAGVGSYRLRWRRRPRRLGRHRAAMRGRQDHRRHRGDGPDSAEHARAHNEHHGRQAMEA